MCISRDYFSFAGSRGGSAGVGSPGRSWRSVVVCHGARLDFVGYLGKDFLPLNRL